jgi:hypothetical protein
MSYLLFDGVFNKAAMGLPIYIWILLILLLFAVFSCVLWYVLFWMPLKPLHGLFEAYMKKQFVAFVFDYNLKFILKSERNAKLLYDESIGAAKKAQPDWDDAPSGRIGKVQTDLIFDGDRWTEIGSPARKEIDACVQVWNEAQEYKTEREKDEIHTLIKFARYLHEGKVACNIRKEIIVPWIRIKSSLVTKSRGQWAGYIRQLANDMQAVDKSDYTMFGVYILVFCGFICIALILTKVLHLM